MTEDEISVFLEPHFEVLRRVCDGADDQKISEARRALSAIVSRFNFPPVKHYADRSFDGFHKAEKYIDFRKKNEAASEAATYFLDRGYVTILECEKNRMANQTAHPTTL